MSYPQHHRGQGSTASEHRLPAPPPDSLPNASFTEVMICCTLGAFVQYYDFFAVYYFKSEIKKAFFPDDFSQWQLNTILFYVPYLIRPFTGLWFGYWSDRYGRRSALLVTTFGMGIPSVLLGCIPKYDHIGYLSVIFVIILRIIQVKTHNY